MPLPRFTAIALALALAPAPLLAQAIVQPLGTSDADQLADQVRRLGANPLDLDALLTAGELSTRLGDLTAAAAFFARAEKIDPRNARAKAGEGAILVRSERPGEALRYFGQAESLGLPPARFAADRGLAYDLLGDQPRAQRDYRAAQQAGDSDEVRRRYALSFGIAGRKQQALDQLAPLIRRNDRAAWRDRAFILAMTGDGAEALVIAQTMMPPGSAQGLRGFFAQLPSLPAIDRAFAVHFGEVHATAARLADARLAPALTPLSPEPEPAVQVAAGTPIVTTGSGKGKKGKRSQVAAPSAPLPLVAAAPDPAPPPYQPPAYQPPADRAPVAVAAADRPLTPGEQASLLAAGLRSGSSRRSRPTPTAGSLASAARPLTPAEQANLAAATIGRNAAPARREAAIAAASPILPTTSFTAPSPRAVLPSVGAGANTPATPAAPLPAVARLAPAPVAAGSDAARGGLIPAAPGGPAPAATSVAARTPPAPLIVATPPVVTPVPAIGLAMANVAPAPAVTGVPSAQPTAPAAVLPNVAPVLASPSATAPADTAIASATPSAPGDATPTPRPARSALPTTLASVPPSAQVAARRPTPGAGRIGHTQADAILARIVAGLSIPASELDVTGPARAAPGARASASGRMAAGKATAAAKTPDRRTVVDRGSPAEAASLSRGERRAVAQKLAAGESLSQEETAALLAGADVRPATWPVTRAERRGVAAAIAADRPLTRSQQRVIAASVAADAPARGGKRAVAARDDTPAAPTPRERRALAARVAAGTPLGDDDRAALGLGDVTPAKAPPTRAARRALAAAVASGEPLSHVQQRQLAALTDADAPDARPRRGGVKDADDAPAPKGKRGKDTDDKRAAKSEPSRIWVQVAGGANEGDLTKAWAATKAKAPGAFAGRQAWTTPLRATNRVLTGPFKTDAAARAYVNQLAKGGVSAFAFTSDAGQKVTRLGDE
ncbi:SPOR domain-containing protein [uncultured Sphingomonas sp.]|uniref:SPOR domain-containing protein n=1 Tax=uncultured Sphingomonas sp. TaxID=158754 RepID=UPI0035CBDB88